MAVAGKHAPARGFKTGKLVGGVGERDLAVNRDAVIIPKHNQLAEALHARKADGLLRDAFHQAAIARNDICIVIHDLFAVAGLHRGFAHGHANGGGKPRAQGAGGGFNAFCMAIFRVASRARALLAEIPDVLDGHLRVTGEVQQPVDQHGAVAGGEDEAVTIRPRGLTGIKFQVVTEKHRGDIGHAHRHAGVAGIGCLHGVNRQHPQRGRLGEMIRVAGFQVSYFHGVSPVLLHLGLVSRPLGGVKRYFAIRGGKFGICRYYGAITRFGLREARMDDLETLANRLAAAVDVLSLQSKADAREILDLRAELEMLKEKRKADMAELDTLLAHLKPLMEAEENA